jgi:hypothetical protein
MAFRTKLDFSNNRQVKQFEQTKTVLSGGTSFGLTFSALTTGPNPTTTGETNNFTFVASTFSGNSATTVYNWYDAGMSLAEPYFSALTPSISSITQTVNSVFTAETTTVIDNNTVVLSYSGVGFDITPIAMYDLGGGAYSGTVETVDLFYYSATSLGYTGRTIWVDVSGITRTENLIITNNPVIGNVWMCVDSEGRGYWSPVSAATTTAIWISGTGVSSAILNGNSGSANGGYSVSEGYQTVASADASHAEGDRTRALGDYSHAGGQSVTAYGLGSFIHANGNTLNPTEYGVSGTSSVILGGQFNKILINADASAIIGGSYNVVDTGVSNSVILGGTGMSATTANTTYVDKLNIKTLGVYADNAAATSAGLEVGTVYRTSTGQLMVRY